VQGDGSIRQVKTLAGLLDVVPLSDRAYEVRKYAPQQVGAKAGGLYTVNGNPIRTMHVSAPAGEADKVIITNQSGTQSSVTTHTVTTDPVTGESWFQDIQMGAFELERELHRVPDAAQGPGHNTVTRRARITTAPGLQAPPGGDDYVYETTEKNYAPLQTKETFRNGTELTRSRSYAAVGWDAEGVGRTQSQTKSTGTQVSYTIDPATQRMTSRQSQIQLAPGTGGSAPTTRQEDYDYTPLAAGETLTPFDFRPRMTSVFEDGQAVSLSFASYRIDAGEYVETTEDVPGLAAPFGDADNRRVERRYFGSGINQGRLRQVRQADGTLTQYDYAPQVGGGLLVTELNRLSPAGTPVNGHSTRTVTLRDVRGWPVETTRAHWVNGAWLDFEKFVETRDLSGHLTSRVRHDLLSGTQRTLLEQEWDGDLLTRRIDEHGVATRFEYFAGSDLVEREIREAVPAQGNYPAQPEMVTTYSGTFQLDKRQVPLWETKTATTTAGGITLTTTTVYDEQGRIALQTDANGSTTLTTHTADDLVTTVTHPSGATEITRRTSEGRILSVTGSALVDRFHHHTPLSGGGRRETVYLALDNGPRWSRSDRDGAGRIAALAQPAFGGGVAETVYHYDSGGCACGKPTKITRTGLPATLYTYNSVHERVQTALSGDDEIITLDSATDRITGDVTTAELQGNRLWLVRRQSVFPEAGSAAEKTVQITRQLLAGFVGDEVEVIETEDIAGNITTQVVERNRVTRLETRRTVSPAATDDALAVRHAGRLVLEHRRGSNGDVTYGHDALGRVVSIQKPGHANPATRTYEPGKNRLASETDAAGHATSFAYVPAGQPGAGAVQSVTAADGGVTTTDYDLLGRVVKRSGARTYPVEFTYNAYGERATLTTWQDHAGTQGAAVTTWTHDAATGLLTSQTDAQNRSVNYTYDAAQRLLTRTWARGVITTYGYDPVTAELTLVDYSDATPDVTLTHDRLGRQVTATTANVAQSAFTYRAATLQVETETLRQDLDGNGTFDFERTFTRTQDALLRPAGFSLGLTGQPAETAVTYGYEPVAGRFASVTLPDARAFTYAYDPARPHLQSTVTGPAHRVVNTWEPNRDVLDVKSNQTLTGTELSRYDYTVNAIGQRTAVDATGSAYALLGGNPGNRGWTWSYDSLGQLTDATHASDPAHHRGYAYDDIGNRTQATEPALTTTYTANLLNQYTSVSSASSVVSPVFDHDGNQLSGALGAASGQTFEWDGANRLKTVKDPSGTVLVTYTYDHASRRIRRTTATEDRLFLYDDWNVVAEYTHTAGIVTLTQTHTWGLDLSGSLQGAGGVGGLLLTEDVAGGTTNYPAYDGNGNVTTLVDGTGAASGIYEYDPYGNLLASAGPATTTNPYRFSTKPVDPETGWLYYGYRWYDPVEGRWTSRDPIEEAGGRNLYGFVDNDPIDWFDIFGKGKGKGSPGGNNRWRGGGGPTGQGGPRGVRKLPDVQPPGQKGEKHPVVDFARDLAEWLLDPGGIDTVNLRNSQQMCNEAWASLSEEEKKCVKCCVVVVNASTGAPTSARWSRDDCETAKAGPNVHGSHKSLDFYER